MTSFHDNPHAMRRGRNYQGRNIEWRLASLVMLAMIGNGLSAAPAAEPDDARQRTSLVFTRPEMRLAALPGISEVDEEPAVAERIFARPNQPPIDQVYKDATAGNLEVAQVPAVPPANGRAGATPRPLAQERPAIPATNFVSSSIGSTSSAQASAPFMIGDAFGGNSATINYKLEGQSFSYRGSLNLTGRLNLAENFSPMPRDRLFFDYNDFNDVALAGGISQSVNRYTPAFEKTFFNGWSSIEMRMPVASTLNNNISVTGPNNLRQGQFGDLFLSFKTLLWRTDQCAFAGGLALTIPTAQGIALNDFPFDFGLVHMQIQNTAVYFQPYLAGLWTANDRFYAQALVAADVASGGSPIDIQIGADQLSGRLTNQTLLNMSVSAGYWVYRNPGGRYLTGVAPICELHEWQSISHADPVALTLPGLSLGVGGNNDHFQLLNMTTGVNMQLGPLSSLLLGYTTPIGSGSDKQFASEFRLSFNRRFGPQNRLTRSQF